MFKKEEVVREELERTKEEDLARDIEESSFLPSAVCTLNSQNIIVDTNKAFQELTGYQLGEIAGESILKIFLQKEEIIEFLKEIQVKEGLRTKELVLLTKAKKEIPVQISVAVRKDSEGNFIGYFLGISEKAEFKKPQQELEKEVKERTKVLEQSRTALMNILEDVEEARQKAEEEKNKTLAIITSFVDGLLVFDEKKNLILVNPQAEKFFDVKSSEIVGKSILELTTLPNLEPLIKILGKEIETIFRKELSLNEKRIVEVSTTPLLREKEKAGTLVIIHDITREKMIEKMKTEFVSLSAHQLRTPLSAIKWGLKMLLDGDLGEITPEQREFIEKSYKSNERMIGLINDLLDITRIEEGRYLYQSTLCQIEDIVQSVINSYQEEFKKKKIKFEFKRPEEKLPKVKVDEEKMKLAIQNLLDNALRYTLTGGEVTLSLKCVNKEIELSVKDSGIGIPPDQQERIFSKFFRAGNAVRIETEGSGLGLFITKNIIEAHGGKLWFESEENKGSTFWFTLPIK